MSPTRPYQSLLLRLLHGAMALLTLLAISSGFWVYNTYDGRWGSLPLPKPYYTQDLHGTGALALFLFMFPFALYCFHLAIAVYGPTKVGSNYGNLALQAFGSHCRDWLIPSCWWP
ncbi:hypothetical protein [Synechocystis salina]|uniref:hypothetical protein n=1 Tax=Synechocystis salina TaxID=945780 RepID=UPI001D1340A5|nr:hypothetical protein [Synechocystis salina]